jgi:pSer/pThr/pTyr-binding forkhead associated (FHA) protein
MQGKVTLKVIKGEQSGHTFSYDKKETVIIGRHGSCSIQLTDNTVSNQHCILNIIPPLVTVYDCGSLNGTYINGTIIGQRKNGDTESAIYTLNSGDRLGLGKSCELTLSIIRPPICSICKNDENEISHNTSDGFSICSSCHSNPDKVLNFLIQTTEIVSDDG